MAEELICKYLSGTCYSCQKCLYCFQSSQQDSCKCKKTKQPLRTKTPKRGQQIYQRAFTPDQFFPKANKLLFDANIKFGYNSNFENPFSYTFCSACNSKIQRLRHEDKITQQAKKNDNEMNTSDISSNEKEVDNIDTDDNIDKEKNNEEYYVIEEEEDLEDSDNDDLEEIKIQLVVKSKKITVPTAKTVTITPVNYENVMEKIISEVQKILKKKIKSVDYTISYKAVNARGPSNTLEDRSDFQEFVSEYQKVFLSGKKMSVIVVVRDKKKTVKKHRKVKIFFYLHITR